MGGKFLLAISPSTMGQNRKRQIKSPSNHSLFHERGSERSERASEQTDEPTSEWPSTSVCIHGCSGPLCFVFLVDFKSKEAGEEAGIINNITAWLRGRENDQDNIKSRFSLCGEMDLIKLGKVFSAKNEGQSNRSRRSWMRLRVQCPEDSGGRSILVVHLMGIGCSTDIF